MSSALIVPVAFPVLVTVAPYVAAYRAVVRSAKGAPGIVDSVAFRNGRAQSHIFFAGGPSAYPRDEEVRLARIVARRTAAAMRR
jgi:hypothetical protein